MSFLFAAAPGSVLEHISHPSLRYETGTTTVSLSPTFPSEKTLKQLFYASFRKHRKNRQESRPSIRPAATLILDPISSITHHTTTHWPSIARITCRTIVHLTRTSRRVSRTAGTTDTVDLGAKVVAAAGVLCIGVKENPGSKATAGLTETHQTTSSIRTRL